MLELHRAIWRKDFQVDGSFIDIESIFYKIHDISLHQKTAKAIRSKRDAIEEKLHQLDKKADIENNIKCRMLLDMMRSTLSVNGSYCCRCNRPLSKTEVMECNVCSIMTYCSRACQREDWLNGHSVTCNEVCTNENFGRFQGRVQPTSVPKDERAATKLKELEKNLTMIQQKLFLDNSENILAQAKELNLPLYDCIVVFDLRTCPPTVKTVHYSDSDDLEGFEKTRSKDNITCAYVSKMYISKGSYEYEDMAVLGMQRLFPHEWLTNKRK